MKMIIESVSQGNSLAAIILITTTITQGQQNEVHGQIMAFPGGEYLGLSEKCYQPGFPASLIDRNLPEARQEIQVRLYHSSREREQTVGSLACLLRGGASWFLACRECRGVSRGQAGGVARWFAHPFGGAMCSGHAQHPALAPSSQKCSWFSVFLYLVHNLSQLCTHSVVFTLM